jgi:hypothetical protein
MLNVADLIETDLGVLGADSGGRVIEAAGHHPRPRSRFLITRSGCDRRHIIGSLFRVLVRARVRNEGQPLAPRPTTEPEPERCSSVMRCFGW